MTMREDAHAVLAALEHDWADAWQSGHAIRCAQLMADDFVEVSSRGQIISKGEWLACVGTSAPRRVRCGEGRVRLIGRSAIVYSKMYLAGASRGHEYSAEFLVTDNWTFHGEQWQVISRQLTRVRGA